MVNKEEKFNIIYEELYNKYFDKFENIRIKEKRTSKISLLGFAFVVLAVGFIKIYLDEKENIFLIYIAAILGIIGGIIIYSQRNKKSNYYELYKNKVITEFVNNILPDFKYLPDADIEVKNRMITLYKDAQFDTKEFNRSSSDDFMVGKINNIRLSICDLSTYYEYIKNKEKEQEYRFSGLFVNAKLARSSAKKVEIKILNKNKNKSEIRNVVDLDNNEFNNNFLVVSNSDIEAYEILTSDVMQILNDCMKENNIEFDISIKNERIYFRFYTIPIFEPSVNETGMKRENFYRYYNLLNYVIEFSTIVNKIYEDLNF